MAFAPLAGLKSWWGELLEKARVSGWIAGRNFGDLFEVEFAEIEGRKERLPTEPDPRNRRWRRVPPERDLFGLALSGGGIRSATFNLGLLQGLDRLGLLGCLDFVSTVSGGGYIGGFWTSWRHHMHHPPDEPAWPTRLDAEDRRFGYRPTGQPLPGLFPRGNGDEPWPIRNLREFGNFLSPRPGVLSTDFGRLVVAVLAALLPCLLATVGLIFTMYSVWMFVALDFASVVQASGAWYAPILDIRWSMAVFLLVTALVLFGFEDTWRRRELGPSADDEVPHPGATEPYAQGAYRVGVVVALLSLLALTPATRVALGEFELIPPTDGAWVGLLVHLATASAGWALPALAYLVFRSVLGRGSDRYERTQNQAAWDRVAGRLLLLTAIWLTLSALWVFAAWLYRRAGLGSVGFAGGLFATVAWLATGARAHAERLLRTVGSGGGLPTKLRLRLPSLLAHGAVLLLMVAVGLLAVGYLDGALHPRTPIAALVLVGASLAYLDPNRIGLHGFYRGRITRAFLGAANPHAGYPPRRHTEELASDDIRMRDVDTGGPPLHLVCAAANDLAPVDPLRNLGRGARSAVFSPVGYQVHNEWRRWNESDRVGLSSVLTASGAAINPMMGRFSRALGRGVTFLMASCGLRLGLWLKHPTFEMPRDADRLSADRHAEASRALEKKRGFLARLGERARLGWQATRELGRVLHVAIRGAPLGSLVEGALSVLPLLPRPGSANVWALPGRLHLKELFGSSDAEGGDLNVSDGGHFENLALYELIRRHCRYVIVSDCGADPKTAFGDLANLIRRVRQDFGVEVQLDLSPLEPDERGYARQRVVAGDILYPDGDVGVLLVFKPALLGDEPGDILQYRRSDAAFPQQPTYDQFYDDAQWESYRRLGEFAARTAFGFLESDGDGLDRRESRARAAGAFADARFEWLPRPPDFMARHAEAGRAIAELETLLHSTGGILLRQVFKELREIEGDRRAGGGSGSWSEHPRWPDEMLALEDGEAVRSLQVLRQALQVMQKIFHLLDLEQRHSDPVNLGIMNYLARWAGAPLLHLWWPLLQTMQEPGFVRFMERRLDLPSSDPERTRRTVGTARTITGLGFAGLAWLQRRDSIDGSLDPEAQGIDVDNVYEFNLRLPYGAASARDGEPRDLHLQAALIHVTQPSSDDPTSPWFWRDQDLFVPAGLWGVGIGENFIRAFVKQRSPCLVAIGGGSRRAREALLYKSAGFVEAAPRVVGGVLRVQPIEGDPITLHGEALSLLDGASPEDFLWLGYRPPGEGIMVELAR